MFSLDNHPLIDPTTVQTRKKGKVITRRIVEYRGWGEREYRGCKTYAR